VVTQIEIKNWAEETEGNALDAANPIGVAVYYERFSRTSELLPEFKDQAMWERFPLNRQVLYETHRGPITAARAEQFNAAMAAIWADLKQFVIQREKERLGL